MEKFTMENTVKEMREYAEANGIEIPVSAKKKAHILAFIVGGREDDAEKVAEERKATGVPTRTARNLRKLWRFPRKSR